MLLKQKVETIKLTQYIMEQYWQKNYEPLIEHVCDNVLWIALWTMSMFMGKSHGRQNNEK